ncbi:DUF2730 family protein [Xanthobacter sp. VTT E-85241]|uniref:DUF2730 family protein n=1 Tax=Roseixanthobacter finlandensis TaxID=3119922 RepID=UPI003729919F
MEELNRWAPIIISLASLITVWVLAVRSVRRSETDALETSIAGTRKELAGVADRVARTESQIAHLPDKDLTHRMEMALVELRGDLRVLRADLAPIAATNERLNEFLLDQGRRE